MNLHEYQAKELLRGYGLPVPPGEVCRSPDEARAAAERLGGRCVVKAQVHAGGRGKAGGIKPAGSPAEAERAAAQILGMRLVTAQRGGAGHPVHAGLVAAQADIAAEYYLGLLVNRARRRVSVIASRHGGVEIERTAHEDPAAVHSRDIDPCVGYQAFLGVELASALGLSGSAARAFAALLGVLNRALREKDLLLLEINPLVLTPAGEFLLLDAKCSMDANALFRHEPEARCRDDQEIDERERRAARFGLSYVAMEGDIGCVVNGAGLAMATMDIIKHCGGEPANFLDVGGGASQESVTEAFRILLSDRKLKAILVNIFGGIMRCDVIANGVVSAARELGVSVPLVVRLQGTNVAAGREILQRSGLRIVPADTMAEAAQTVVALAAGRGA